MLIACGVILWLDLNYLLHWLPCINKHRGSQPGGMNHRLFNYFESFQS